jgi:hypothetical protein
MVILVQLVSLALKVPLDLLVHLVLKVRQV